jgi:F0F1-type ATP synthase beta subunit
MVSMKDYSTVLTLSEGDLDGLVVLGRVVGKDEGGKVGFFDGSSVGKGVGCRDICKQQVRYQ